MTESPIIRAVSKARETQRTQHIYARARARECVKPGSLHFLHFVGFRGEFDGTGKRERGVAHPQAWNTHRLL
jgi:hypothetical protein